MANRPYRQDRNNSADDGYQRFDKSIDYFFMRALALGKLETAFGTMFMFGQASNTVNSMFALHSLQ